MANVCLPRLEASKFTDAIISGKINPEELANLSSAERRAAIASIIGEDSAKIVNSLFESKMLLKNQKTAYVNWAKKVSGITPEVRQDLISRIEKMDKVLDPEDSSRFLSDLASTRLGFDVTQAEAKQIADLSKAVSDARLLQKADGTFATDEQRMAYGYAKADLASFVSDAKNGAQMTIKGAISDPTGTVKLGGSKLAHAVTHPAKTFTATAGLSKSVKASLDNSAIFRQGWKTMFNNPTLWSKNMIKTWGDIAGSIRGKDMIRHLDADVLSRPNYNLYRKAGLATSTVEEAFPSQLPERIPGLGRVFKASESAYTGFLHRQRADVFDKYLEIMKRQEVPLDEANLQAVGKLVNSLTGRGHLGGLEPAANTVNNIFFSPRALKANIDTLTAHQFQKNITPFARKQAAIATAKVVAGTAAVLGIANAVMPGSVEADPRSADFGKIKVGNTRFDVTAGMSSILNLAARIVTQSSKSSSTGVVSKLGGGYGETSGVDLITQFLENKLSPTASVFRDIIKQQDFSGNKPTLAGELKNAFMPLPVTNYEELSKDPNSAGVLAGMLADGLGISTNTYGMSNKDWSQSDGKELNQFKDKVGADEFKKANDRYNSEYDQWFKDHKKEIDSKANDEKQPFINKETDKLRDNIFQSYGFKYKQERKKK